MFRKIVGVFAICALALNLTACSKGSSEPILQKPQGKFGGEPGSNMKAEDSVQGIDDRDLPTK